ncbi:hypothetical protein [Niabella hibiscisoli]|uniref:hypothetical protein n=1 Tax=Niabella hibiscisoli TaxID=1825928 RepID=UPI001F0ED620|nr:hypothetical protein [Niabella hibiscisoli]MCH5719119.1 hypothetical protein [Niabella hibiscisoli]
MENEFSRVDQPVVVKIFEDGRFEARIPMWYPKIVEMDLNNQWLSFYIEPGQALGLVIDWRVFRKNEKPEAIQFNGPLADINRNRYSIPIFKTDPEWVTRQAVKADPVEFKRKRLKSGMTRAGYWIQFCSIIMRMKNKKLWLMQN